MGDNNEPQYDKLYLQEHLLPNKQKDADNSNAPADVSNVNHQNVKISSERDNRLTDHPRFEIKEESRIMYEYRKENGVTKLKHKKSKNAQKSLLRFLHI